MGDEKADFLAGLPSLRFIREKELLELLSISHATLWRWVKDGSFPAPCKLGPGVTAWAETEVREHLQKLLASRAEADETVTSGRSIGRSPVKAARRAVSRR